MIISSHKKKNEVMPFAARWDGPRMDISQRKFDETHVFVFFFVLFFDVGSWGRGVSIETSLSSPENREEKSKDPAS